MAQGSPRLGQEAEAAVGDPGNDISVSAVSAYEIAQKHRLGKLASASHLARQFEAEMKTEGFELLSITAAEARLAGAITGDHRDPLDRLLIARALLNDMTLVSNERIFDSFGVSRLW